VFSHVLDALRYVLLNIGEPATPWTLGPPQRGITKGLWNKIY
jgi:hypothetical protein